ncbi:MAG TPA: PilZ domain-containing protein [Ensifer sp.]|nr:PilZ domain-containing protein [Ensifer sp.]
MGLHFTGTEPHRPDAEFDFERFPVNLPTRLIMIGHHFKSSEALCMMKDVSASGAKLKVDPDLMVPSHFFIIINGLHDEIGCTLVKRTLESVSLKFNMLLADDFVEMILRRNTAFELNN